MFCDENSSDTLTHTPFLKADAGPCLLRTLVPSSSFNFNSSDRIIHLNRNLIMSIPNFKALNSLYTQQKALSRSYQVPYHTHTQGAVNRTEPFSHLQAWQSQRTGTVTLGWIPTEHQFPVFKISTYTERTVMMR